MVLLLLAVLVPAVCLVWFMAAAMRNERLAARQRLAEAYRIQLTTLQERLAEHWKVTVASLENVAATNLPSAAFFKCVQSGIVDSAVILNDEGGISYPNTPSPVKSDFGQLERRWQEARQLEDLRKYVEAANRYDAVARDLTNDHAAARTFQAEARCLAQAGQNERVVQLVNEVFNDERYLHAADLQGRLIAANAELMALELMTNRSSPLFESIARRLTERLNDYENPALAAPQRRFLMKEAQRLHKVGFPTLIAEQLAADVSASFSNSPRGTALQRSSIPDVWQFITPNRRVVALARGDTVVAAPNKAMALGSSLGDVTITLAAPDADTSNHLVTIHAGEQMPGWRLALSLNERGFFDMTAARQTAVYLWTGILVVVAMMVLTFITVRLVRRQLSLARLKNDLAATVSHELKTPVSSMRVLVETLLASEKFDEGKTREYLQLIARENERLGRLIQNFLTFSRMERNKYIFHFSLVPARQIVDAAVQSVRERFDSPGCRFEVQIEDDLPQVMADSDALTSALINLLENAYKYSEEIKHIVLHARADNGNVVLTVKDNGFGIAPRERKRVFRPFYQVDQRLRRNASGCGLGLSIVQLITAAHQGKVYVESEPGRGSTFTVSLPAAAESTAIRREAIA